MIPDLFFDLLRLAVGSSESLPRIPSEKEWNKIYSASESQGVVGLCFAAANTMTDSNLEDYAGMSENTFLDWLSYAAGISETNKIVDNKCVEVLKTLSDSGFDGTVLKGQGIADLYPESIKGMRMPGDIDIWIHPDADKKELVSFAKSHFKCTKITYHHISIDLGDKLELELHFTPSWMYSPFKNHRLQNWFAGQVPEQFLKQDGSFKRTTASFDMVFIPVHIFRHILSEGIGMKQIIDYYEVLQVFNGDKKECEKTLKALGLKKFTSALMYILKEYLGMDEERLVFSPDEKEGRFLIDEIIQSGNMGLSDKRLERKKMGSEWSRFITHCTRNLRFLRHYPSEVLWSPIWKIWHFFWRKAI